MWLLCEDISRGYRKHMLRAGTYLINSVSLCKEKLSEETVLTPPPPWEETHGREKRAFSEDKGGGVSSELQPEH